MPSLLMRALLLYTTITSVHALALAPKATTTAIFKTTAAVVVLQNALHGGYGPRPTAPPALHELFGRQGLGDVEYIVAPDNTCGYIGSKKEDELYVVCVDPITRRCVMLRNVALTSGIVACCNGTSCEVTTQCVPYSQISAGNCDAMCMGNNNALICSESNSPYCNTMSYSGGITDYFCSSKEYLFPIPARTTRISGPARNYATLTDTQDVNFNTVTAAPPPSGSTSNSIITTNSGGATANSTSTTSNAAGAATIPDRAQDGSRNGPSVPVGPVVGYTFAGAAAIAGAAAGLIFWRRHKAKQAAAAAAAAGNNNNGGSSSGAAELPDKAAAASVSSPTTTMATAMTIPSPLTPTIPVIHEASGNAVGAPRDQNDNHRGEIYEMP